MYALIEKKLISTKMLAHQNGIARGNSRTFSNFVLLLQNIFSPYLILLNLSWTGKKVSGKISGDFFF